MVAYAARRAELLFKLLITTTLSLQYSSIKTVRYHAHFLCINKNEICAFISKYVQQKKQNNPRH